jgi:DNA-binding GntR family transcriptional regulator
VHTTLVERSGNRTIATLTGLLHNLLLAYYLDSMDRVDQALMRRAVRGYRRLVVHIENGDADAAIAHWQATMRYTVSGRDTAQLVTIAAAP